MKPKPLSIFIGYDEREHAAYQVACASILAAASVPVLITPLVLSHLPFLTRTVERRGNRLWCPISGAPMSTEFAISRFAIPFLQSTGWALFIDCDFVAMADVKDLFALVDDRYALMCVPNTHEWGDGKKMDDQVQTVYSKKLWSSLMLWNLDHPAHQRLTLEVLNSWPGRDLHAFKWLETEEIGLLPRHWNILAGIDDKDDVADARFIHFTLGQRGLLC